MTHKNLLIITLLAITAVGCGQTPKKQAENANLSGQEIGSVGNTNGNCKQRNLCGAE